MIPPFLRNAHTDMRGFLGNILQKLGVVSRLEAVLWAKAHGFL